MRPLLTSAVSALLFSTGLAGLAHAAPVCNAPFPEPITGWNFVPPSVPGPDPSDFEVFLPGNQLGCQTEGYISFQNPSFPSLPTATYEPAHNQTVLT